MSAPSFGQIVEFDAANQTGVIEQYDGERAIFHLNDLVALQEEMSMPRVGQRVLFSPKVNPSGSLQAYEIQIVE